MKSSDLLLTVKAEVDTHSALIGDRITYTIGVKTKKNIDVQFSSFGENLSGLTVKDSGSSRGGFWNSATYTEWYTLESYTPGHHTIPGALIKYKETTEEEWKEVMTEEITVEVQSLLDKADVSPEIKDIKGPLRLFNLMSLSVILAVIMLIAIIIIAVRLRHKRIKEDELYLPPRPAHEIAFEALYALRNKNYIRNGKVQEYYFEISDIVRHYLENRFSLKAPEMTTEEFLSHVKNSDLLRSEHKSLLREFLSHCDMVKFARYHPEEKEIESSFESAEHLVQQTRESSEEVEKA